MALTSNNLLLHMSFHTTEGVGSVYSLTSEAAGCQHDVNRLRHFAQLGTASPHGLPDIQPQLRGKHKPGTSTAGC